MFMLFFNHYFPDYEGMLNQDNETGRRISLSPEILDYLRKSDRQMKYQDCDRKRELWEIDMNAGTARYLGNREESLDRLLEDGQDFVSEGPSVEELVVQDALLAQFQRAIAQLSATEWSVIKNIFHEQKTEQETAQSFGIAKQMVNYRKRIALAKLKKLMEI